MKVKEQVMGWLHERGFGPSEENTPGKVPAPGDIPFFLSAFSLALCFGIQAVTGIFLSMYYSPSVTDAWASVWYIHTQVTWGDIVRGLHYFGSSAMVVIAVFHLVILFLRGGYKKKGEFIWYSAILVLFMTFGFGLTGYLLPYDQMGYWASQVRTGIVGSLPVVGDLAKTLLIGGTEFGNLTLTRFSALHTLVLPLLTVGLLLLHSRALKRRLVDTDDGDARWVHIFQKSILGAVIVGALLTVALVVEAPLEPPADPASTYEARPEWYFLFLFQLLKYFEGPLALIGTVILPGLGTGFLFALPFLDGGEETAIRKRAPWAIGFFSIFVFAGVMSAVALLEDANSAHYQEALANQTHDAEEALRLAAADGVQVDGHIAAYTGYKLFDGKGCLGCHGVDGRKEPDEKLAPRLTGYLTREWFREFLIAPDSDRFYGGVPAEGDNEWDMPGIHSEDIDIQSKEDLNAIVEWMVAQSGRPHSPPVDQELAARGLELIEDEACSSCHSTEGEEMDGPALDGYGSESWLAKVIRTPHAPEMFGERNTMPGFEELSDQQVNDLIRYLVNLK